MRGADDDNALLTLAVALLILVAAIWWFLAPCSWHLWAAAHDVPARCLGEAPKR